MGKTKIKIQGKINIEIEIYKFLSEIRRDLLDIVNFLLYLLMMMIMKYLKKKNKLQNQKIYQAEKIKYLKNQMKRKMLGRKIESKD